MANLALRHIYKVYPNGVKAVNDFNMEIKDEEFIVFVGPSGCGKSTTLRMIAGLETITSGEFYIDGELMNQVEPMNRNVAMVFQNYALYPHMSVYGNMKFALKLRKIPHPVYTNLDDIKDINEENKIIRKQISAIDAKFKKNQNDDSLLPERAELYKKLFENEDRKKTILVQAVGIDQYTIKETEKSIKKREKSLKKNQHIIDKYAERYPEECKGLEEENANTLKQIEAFKEKIEYLKKNEVPLFEMRKLTKEEMDLEINKVAESIDLTRYLFRKPAALSGGQRQRVAIARAMLRNAPIVILDEATSALDNESEAIVQKAMDNLMKNRTVFIIAHRLSTIKNANRIAVINEGELVELGTHDELMNIEHGEYKALYEMQFKHQETVNA